MDLLGFKSEEAGDTSTSWTKSIGDWYLWLEEKVTNAMVTIGFYLNNFGDLMDLAATSAIYQVVRLGNQIEYTFTEVIPGLLYWLKDNWWDIFKTIGSLTASVFTNMASNIWKFFGAVKDWMMGKGFSFDWTPLTDGFKNSIKELPKIAARQAGPLEQALADQQKALEFKLGKGLADALAKNKKIGEDAAKGIQNAMKPPPEPDKPPEPNKPPVINTNLNLDTTDANDALDKVKTKGEETAKALSNSDVGVILSGSAEQALRMANAAVPKPLAIPEPAAVPTPLPRDAVAAVQSAGKSQDTSTASGSLPTQILDLLKQLLPRIEKNTSEQLQLVEGR